MRTVLPPTNVKRFTRRQYGLISTAQCDRLNISPQRRRTLVARGLWNRVVRGVYDTEPRALWDLDERRRRTAWIGLLAMGAKAIAVGSCALALHGVAGLPQDLEPEVALPDNRSVRGPPGVRVRRYSDVPVRVKFASRAVSDVPTALVHTLPRLTREHAVAVLDSALNKDLITPQDLPDLRQRLRGRRGSVRARRWLSLADGRAQSPLETWARLDCIDHDLPPNELQVPLLRSDGSVFGYGDMGWRRCDGGWVVVEMDGQDVHSAPQALFRDRERQNQILIRAGTVLLRFTIHEVRQPGTIARHVHQALTAATPATPLRPATPSSLIPPGGVPDTPATRRE